MTAESQWLYSVSVGKLHDDDDRCIYGTFITCSSVTSLLNSSLHRRPFWLLSLVFARALGGSYCSKFMYEFLQVPRCALLFWRSEEPRSHIAWLKSDQLSLQKPTHGYITVDNFYMNPHVTEVWWSTAYDQTPALVCTFVQNANESGSSVTHCNAMVALQSELRRKHLHQPEIS